MAAKSSRTTFQVRGRRLDECSKCGLLFFNPQPSAAELSRIYSTGYLLGDTENNLQRASALKRASAGLLLDLTSDYCGPGRVHDRKLLTSVADRAIYWPWLSTQDSRSQELTFRESYWTRQRVMLRELNCILELSKPLTYPRRVSTSAFWQTHWDMCRIR